MIKVLLVDDELLVRVGIRSTVNWDMLGMTVVGEAEDGEEALRLYRDCQPDLIITDIKMPGMDGLQLTRQIKELDARAKIIILTCHGEFDYAKEALRLGALEYILKPTMMGGDLEEVVDRAKKIILEERVNERKVTEMELKIRQLQESEQAKRLLRLIDGTEEESRAAPDSDDSLLCRMPLQAVCLLSDNDFAQWEAMRSTMTGVIRKYGMGMTVHDPRNNDLVAVLHFPDIKSESAQYEKLHQTAQEIMDTARQFFGIAVTIGLGEPAQALGRIRASVEQARKSAQCRLFHGRGSIIAFRDLPRTTGRTDAWKSGLQLLRSALAQGDAEQVKRSTHALFAEQIRPTCQPSCVKEAVFELVSLTADFSQLETVMRMETLEQMEQWFSRRFAERLAAESERSETGDYSMHVKEALQYIKLRYMHEISLTDAAEAVFLSKNYLGHLFKRDTGRYFSEYLTEYRMEKAKELLKDGSLKVYAVAMKVGIADQRYFSKLFKKHT